MDVCSCFSVEVASGGGSEVVAYFPFDGVIGLGCAPLNVQHGAEVFVVWLRNVVVDVGGVGMDLDIDH